MKPVLNNKAATGVNPHVSTFLCKWGNQAVTIRILRNFKKERESEEIKVFLQLFFVLGQ